MRITIIIFSLAIYALGFSQTFQEIDGVTKDVIEIKQTYFNGIFKSGWRSFYSYGQGDLLTQQNYFRGELRMDKKYEYSRGDKWTKVRDNYSDNTGFNTIITYYDHDAHIVKSERFSSRDTLRPFFVEHDFVYDENQNLKSYKTTHYYERDEYIIDIDCFELTYQNDHLSSILSYDSCKKLTKSIVVTRSRLGNTINEKIDHQDPEVVIPGARSEGGIQRYRYKFDKKGNWTKRYYVTSSGRKIKDIKRKIKYKTST